MSFNKKIYIDNIVISAKVGSKDSLNRLQEIYKFAINEVYNSFCEIYKFLKERKMEVYYDYDIAFKQSINSYDFSGYLSFSYHVREKIIESTKKTLLKYGYTQKILVSNKAIVSKIRRAECLLDRSEVFSCMKTISVLQK
ncbi:unnamed protein product, partial [marine sediment metagenome]